MNISIIGGDLRIIRLAEMYAQEGKMLYMLYMYGFEKYFLENLQSNRNILNEKNNSKEKSHPHITELPNVILCENIREAVTNCDIVISGMPFSKDGENVNAPFSKTEIKIEGLKNELNNKTFIAGGIPKDFYDKQIKNIDLLQIDELTILNAIPTVEGTIKIAIEEREETIHESNVLVCGFGRIGKILCNRFKALGANVYCAARKETDLAWIREKRYFPIRYGELCEYAEKFDIVINTVPSLIIKQKELDSFNKNVLIIDVASTPGGIDKEYAEKIKIKVITALGIPGKQMPKTAARYIKEVIDGKIK